MAHDLGHETLRKPLYNDANSEKMPMGLRLRFGLVNNFYFFAVILSLALPVFADSNPKKLAGQQKSGVASKAKKNLKSSKSSAKSARKGSNGSGFDYVSVKSYLNSSDVYQNSFSALLISDKFVAIKIDSLNTLIDLSVHSRLFVTNPRWVQLYPVDIDINTKWMLLKSDERLPVSSPKFKTAMTLAQITKLFKYEDESLFTREVSVMKAHAQEPRNLASVAVNGLGLLEKKVQAYGDRIASLLKTSKKRVKIGQNFLSPDLDGLHCRSASPVVSSVELQANIYGASALNCEPTVSLPLSRDFNFGIRMQIGQIQLHDGVSQNEATRIQILQNLSASEMAEARNLSAQIKYSTPAVCDEMVLTDKRVDVLYCTRNLRGFRSLNDSVIIVGRVSGRNYIYNMAHTAGFSQASTQSVLQTNIDILGLNP